MARNDEEDDESNERPSRKKRGRGLSASNIAILALFCLGLLAGGMLTHQFIEPAFYTTQLVKDMNALQLKNHALDSQVNSLLECMQKENIDPQKCS
ncbi:MAG: hypothetical protein V1494_05670 [Candidatus Diapherotrites archaeon]